MIALAQPTLSQSLSPNPADFKINYLRDTTQRSRNYYRSYFRCELLWLSHNFPNPFRRVLRISKIIIFVTRHNIQKCKSLDVSVVNCFQKLLSSWHDTTQKILDAIPKALWIAFKNYYLRDTTQQWSTYHGSNFGCELLSKIIIFVTRHNALRIAPKSASVVNCFQKLLSSWHDTTNPQSLSMHPLLWIAFKNYYLRDTTQRRISRPIFRFSCELLSKIIIFVTRHNYGCKTDNAGCVVNCFQKLLSSWHDTTVQ